MTAPVNDLSAIRRLAAAFAHRTVTVLTVSTAWPRRGAGSRDSDVKNVNAMQRDRSVHVILYLATASAAKDSWERIAISVPTSISDIQTVRDAVVICEDHWDRIVIIWDSADAKNW